MSEKNRFLCLASGVVGLLLLGVGIQTPGANAAQEKDLAVSGLCIQGSRLGSDFDN
jgi:hypothetical protein